MNNSSANSSSYYYGYIAMGTSSILTNFLVLLILSTNKNLFIGSSFVIGLALGDILDGVALLGNGATRLYGAVNNVAPVNVHPFQCMLYLTPVFLLGNQLPGAMFALIGLERYLAVGHFDWYYTKWTVRKAWLCLLAAYAVCAVALATAFVMIYKQPADVKVSNLCIAPTVTGTGYIFYNYSVSVVGGLVAVATTLVAMVIFTKRKNRLLYYGNKRSCSVNSMLPYVKKQLRHTRSMLSIAVLDFGLVVLPNFLMILSACFGVSVGNSLVPSSQIIISARSCFNLVIYLICNSDFRKEAVKAFCLKKCTKTSLALLRTSKASAALPKQMFGGQNLTDNLHVIEAENKF